MRRFLGLGLLCALGCGPTIAGGPTTAAALPSTFAGEPPARRAESDWPRFLGPTGDGISPETGIIAPWPDKGLRVVWHKPVGIGYGMPSISQGRLFQFDRHDDKARLSCWKSDSAESLWQFEYPTAYEDLYGYNNGPRCCPVVDDDRVYIYGVEGMLHCLQVADGKVVWKVDTQKEFGVVQNFFGVGSTPVIEGDLLIVQVGGSPPGSGTSPSADQKGNGTGIVAFDKRTGQVRYKITDELASYSSPVLATIDGRRWCFVFARGGLVGFEPATGKVDFHYPWRAKDLESVNAANPVVVGNQVFITETYGPGSSLLKVRPGGYDIVWTDADKGRNKAFQCHWNTPIYHDGYLYGDSSRHSPNAEIRCVEMATGKVMWREPGNGHTALMLVDGHLIGLTEVGELLLIKLNPKKYEEVSRLELFSLLKQAGEDRRSAATKEYPWWAAPIVSHGLLYVRGKSTLYCLELMAR